MKGSVYHLSSSDSFNKIVVEASHKSPIIVDFHATWCGPCKQLSPLLDSAAQKGAKVVKVDVDENKSVASSFSISSIPHVMLFHKGNKVGEFKGLDPGNLAKFVEYCLKHTNKFQGQGVAVSGKEIHAQKSVGHQNIGPEPNESDNVYHLKFQYNNQSFERRFNPTDTIKNVKDYVRSKVGANNIKLFTPFPRKEYDDDSMIVSYTFSKHEMITVALK